MAIDVTGNRIDIVRGDDYLIANGRMLHFSPDETDLPLTMTVGAPVVLGVGNGEGMLFQGEGTVLELAPLKVEIEIQSEDTNNVGRGHYRFTLRTNGATTETLAEGVLNLRGAWGGHLTGS